MTVTARPSSQQPVKGMNTSSTLLSEESLREFQSRYGDSASISVAGMDGTSSPTVGDSRAPYAWSTAKILIVAQTLLDSGGPNNLTEEQRSLISSALASSDNEAAAALHRQIEAGHGGLEGAAGAMNQLLRKAGDESTSVSTQGRSTYSTYGQTLWSSQAQASFMSALMRGCVLDGQSTTFLREQMGNVVPDQRWGLGEVQSPAFKAAGGLTPTGSTSSGPSAWSLRATVISMRSPSPPGLRTGRSRVVNDWQLTLRTGCNSTSAVLLARRGADPSCGMVRQPPGIPAVLAARGRHAILML